MKHRDNKIFNCWQTMFRCRGIFACALFLMLAVTGANGQNRTLGEILGTVTDQSGARVVGVDVTLVDTLTGVSTHLKTDSQGVYDAVSVMQGNYTVSFAKSGFKTFTREGVQLGTETITVNAVLSVGSSTETVQVASSAVQLQTDSTELRGDIGSKMILELPTMGMNESTLWELTPGIAPAGVANGSQGLISTNNQIAVNGQQDGMQNFTMDGAVRTTVGGGPEMAAVPLDAIQTENLIASNFGAEYGNAESVINVTTKSGSNQFHGTAYEFVQNNIFNARNYFVPTVAPYRWNYYGVTVGGPIKRNKAFFFFSWMGNPERYYAQGYGTVPTPGELAGDFSQVPGLNANGQSSGQAIPIYIPNTLNYGNGSRTELTGDSFAASGISLDPIAAAYSKLIPTSRPTRGAWIETSRKLHLLPLKVVAPHAGRVD